MKKLWIILAFFVVLQSQGQDLNLSGLEEAPLWYNPALTGVSNCDRLGLNYRNQWLSPTNSKPYKTFLVFGTYNLNSGFLVNQDWLSLGAYFFTDQAGDGKLTTNSARLTSSIQLGELFRGSTVFSLGLGFGLNNRHLDFSNLYFNSQWDHYEFDNSLPNQEPFLYNVYSNYYYNVDVGMNLLIQPKYSDFLIKLGGAASNINRPNSSFYPEIASSSLVDSRIFVYGQYRGRIFSSSVIELNASYFIQNISRYGLIGFCYGSTQFLPNFNYGFSYRSTKDYLFHLGYSKNEWYFSLNYELNYGRLKNYSPMLGSTQLSIQKRFDCKEADGWFNVKRLKSGNGYEERNPFRPIETLAKKCSDGVSRRSLYKKGDNIVAYSLGSGRIIRQKGKDEFNVANTRIYQFSFDYLYYWNKFYSSGVSARMNRLENTTFIPLMISNRIGIPVRKKYLHLQQAVGYNYELRDEKSNYLFNEKGGLALASSLVLQFPSKAMMDFYIEAGYEYASADCRYAYIDQTLQTINGRYSLKYHFVELKLGVIIH